MHEYWKKKKIYFFWSFEQTDATFVILHLRVNVFRVFIPPTSGYCFCEQKSMQYIFQFTRADLIAISARYR